jgi:hypothetical protein
MESQPCDRDDSQQTSSQSTARVRKWWYTSTHQTLYSGSYGYNELDQRTSDTISRVNVVNDGTTSTESAGYTYVYDPSHADALTTVKDASNNVLYSYSYDGVGNFTGSPLGTANTLNQYSATTYNSRGDVTDDGTYAYAYDANDRLVSLTPHNTTADKLTYGYDSQGRRLWKDIYTWSGGAWTYSYSRHYVYDGSNLVGELDQNNVLLTGYTWGPSGLIAVTDYTGSTPKTYVPIIDASGNTAALVDPLAGTVAASYHYDPYGNLLSATGSAQAVCSILGKGLFYDVEARDVGHAANRDSRSNIWLERDPAGEMAGGLNLYQMYRGDPINLSDTSGQAPTASRRADDKIKSPVEIYVEALQKAAHDMGVDPSNLNKLGELYDAGSMDGAADRLKEFKAKTDWLASKDQSWYESNGWTIVDANVARNVPDPNHVIVGINLGGTHGDRYDPETNIYWKGTNEPTAFEMAAPMLPGMAGLKGIQAVIAAYAILESYRVPKSLAAGQSVAQVARQAAGDAVVTGLTYGAVRIGASAFGVAGRTFVAAPSLAAEGEAVAAADSAQLAFKTGGDAEAYLTKLYPGAQTQVRFETAVGSGATRFRIIDVLDQGVANESKMGYTELSDLVRSQISKDAWLVKNNPNIKDVVWHFFRSGNTGKVGAAPEVLQALQQNGIKYVIHQ